MTYTIQQLAQAAGISVRTLHYYDQIKLLTPSFTRPNGYRCYEEKEVLQLQQILFFRELEFSLEEIKKIIHAKNFDVLTALRDQKKLLKMKQARLGRLIQTIDHTIAHTKGGEPMNTDDVYAGLTDTQIEEYKKEAQDRWGNTDAFKQSQERTKNWTKAEYARIQKEADRLLKHLVTIMNKGVSDPDVQADIETHYQGMQQFYDCSYDIYRGLARLYVEDPRFTAYYTKYHPDLAQFMCDAMTYYADQHEKKA